MSSVISLVKPAAKKTADKATSPAVKSAGWKKKMFRQQAAAYGIGGVALVLTGLSLSHLASGVEMLTKSDPVNSWAMATGIDLGFIGLELGQLCVATETLRKQVAKFAGPAVKGTLLASAMMNAYAFAAHATCIPFLTAAALLGISIPALIYVLTRVSVAMFIDCHK